MLRLAAIGFVAVASAAPGGVEGPPDRTWRDGPARFLLSDSEYERFGRLKTNEAREAFVDRFWRRLDPDPATPENEFRARYFTRCGEADRRFARGPDEGWRSDRGRVFLILGEPETIERLPGDPRSIGREAWNYSAVGMGEPLRIVFYKGTDGVFRLDPTYSEGRTERDPRDRRLLVDRFRFRNPSIGRFRSASIIDSSLGGVLGVEPATEQGPSWPKSERAPVREGAVTEEGRAPGRVEDEVFYFQAADGSVLALLLLVVNPARPESEDEMPPYEALATVSAPAGVAAGGAPQTVFLAAYPEEMAFGAHAFIGRVHLEPGTRQRVRYAVADARKRTLLLRTSVLEAPELGTGGFSSSSLVPAERYGPAGEHGGPFTVGSEEVVPRPSPRFRRGEPLRLYLQVYEAALHAETYRSNVDLSFHFERFDGRRWRRHGKPLRVRGAYGASLGIALPIGDWPEGRYRVEVILEDRVAAVRTTAEASFSVTDGPRGR